MSLADEVVAISEQFYHKISGSLDKEYDRIVAEIKMVASRGQKDYTISEQMFRRVGSTQAQNFILKNIIRRLRQEGFTVTERDDSPTYPSVYYIVKW